MRHVPKCIACYAPVDTDIDSLVVCPAGAICGRCGRIAAGQAPYWIYTGERRPVIVQAKSREEALSKVRQSPEYDGFPPDVMQVSEFERRCRPLV